jgi:hypothetical protein
MRGDRGSDGQRNKRWTVHLQDRESWESSLFELSDC